MFKQIIAISTIAAGSLYGYKNRNTIRNFLSKSQVKNTNKEEVQNLSSSYLKNEWLMYQKLFSNPKIQLSPYQKCIKSYIEKEHFSSFEVGKMREAISKCDTIYRSKKN